MFHHISQYKGPDSLPGDDSDGFLTKYEDVYCLYFFDYSLLDVGWGLKLICFKT